MSAPPAEVAAAAAVVQGWLGQDGVKKSAEELAKMSPADRMAYCRRFDQKKMPDWRDPRGS